MAGGIALAVLMLPTVIKTTDEALKLVPNELRWGAVGIGASRQDVNVSVRGGRRVEIKGVPQARWARGLVHGEAVRQVNLLRLRDGRLLMTYGHRREPFGNQARISQDGGRTWSSPIIINSDAISGDMGYPSTVECDDGTLVTVWYELLKDSPNAQLRQARWRL